MRKYPLKKVVNFILPKLTLIATVLFLMPTSFPAWGGERPANAFFGENRPMRSGLTRLDFSFGRPPGVTRLTIRNQSSSWSPGRSERGPRHCRDGYHKSRSGRVYFRPSRTLETGRLAESRVRYVRRPLCSGETVPVTGVYYIYHRHRRIPEFRLESKTTGAVERIYGSGVAQRVRRADSKTSTFCVQCSEKTEECANFCPHCGKKIR